MKHIKFKKNTINNIMAGDTMTVRKSSSLDEFDYEILIRRRGENDYASYCPQLNYMIVGTEHEEVRNLMKDQIEKHIDLIKKNHNLN